MKEKGKVMKNLILCGISKSKFTLVQTHFVRKYLVPSCQCLFNITVEICSLFKEITTYLLRDEKGK